MIERHIDFSRSPRQLGAPAEQIRAPLHEPRRTTRCRPWLPSQRCPWCMADGHVLGREDGFDRQRGIDFRIQPEVAAIVPRAGNVTDDDVEQAMRFLTDEWLSTSPPTTPANARSSPPR